MKQATGDGIIIHNADIEVQVYRREEYGSKKVSGTLWGIQEDLYDNCRYPCHVYMRKGLTLSFAGPKVDFTKVLKNRIRKSRRQSPDDQPYMLMIDGNSMLGVLADNLHALSSSFQPEINTRFSAAAVVIYYPSSDFQGLDLSFNLVSNPFSKAPITREFKHLFRSSSPR